jgi:hypothetical protein
MALTPAQKRTATNMRAKWKRDRGGVINDCQRSFNLLRRIESTDDYGFCACVVTGQRIHFKEVDAGHFISATRQATRFDHRNVHPQSKGSNQFDTTNNSLIYYTIFMVECYGRETVDELLNLSKETKKWEIEELIELRIGWLDQIKSEKKRLGIE